MLHGPQPQFGDVPCRCGAWTGPSGRHNRPSVSEIDHELEPIDSTCSTRTATVDAVCSGGSVPPPGAPTAVHVTFHVTAAVTAKAPSFALPSTLGSPADDRVY